MPKGLKGFQKGHKSYLNSGSREKIKKSLKSLHLFPKNGFKKGIIPWNKGKKGLMPIPWNKGKKLPYPTWNKGKKCPQLSDSKKGDKNYWYGKKMTGRRKLGWKLSEITKGKMSESKNGKNHPNWKGGISFEPYSVDWVETLRRSIRERDNYICQLCNQYGKDVHHIDYNKKNCCPDNLITLCKKCNSTVNFGRIYWMNYFKGLLVDIV